MRESKNFCVNYLTKCSSDMDGTGSTLETCWSDEPDILRVPDQKGVSWLDNMLEMYYSGPEPSIHQYLRERTYLCDFTLCCSVFVYSVVYLQTNAILGGNEGQGFIDKVIKFQRWDINMTTLHYFRQKCGCSCTHDVHRRLKKTIFKKGLYSDIYWPVYLVWW